MNILLSFRISCPYFTTAPYFRKRSNVEYAPWVENGHRIVRDGQTIGYVNGKYMLRISLAELEHKAPSIYSRRALDLLRQLIGGSS